MINNAAQCKIRYLRFNVISVDFPDAGNSIYITLVVFESNDISDDNEELSLSRLSDLTVVPLMRRPIINMYYY